MPARTSLTCALAVVLAVCQPHTASLQTTQLPERSIPIGMPDGRSFIVRVQPAVLATSCQFHHYQTGAFGGFRTTDAIPMGGGAFAIRTGIGDKPATSLKVSVWCASSAMALVEIPALESSGFERTLTLVPMKPVPLAGRVLASPDGVSLTGAEVRVHYSAPWLCAFFNLMDCGVPQWEVAIGRIATDGTFRLLVPDFAADPVVMARASTPLHGAGAFKLRADRSTAPYNYWLELEGGKFGDVAVAASYPELRLLPRRH